MRTESTVSIGLCTWVALGTVAFAQAPEISHVFPDFPDVRANHVITGENFDAKTLEVWCWRPPADKAGAQPRLPGSAQAPLPVKPPKGARRIGPLDVEKQTIVVGPIGAEVLWVKTAGGFSSPYSPVQ